MRAARHQGNQQYQSLSVGEMSSPANIIVFGVLILQVRVIRSLQSVDRTMMRVARHQDPYRWKT